MRFNGILLDLDDTLYAYEEPHKAAKHAAFTHLSSVTHLAISELEIRYELAKTQVKRHTGATAASHSRILYFQNMCEGLDIKPYKLAPFLDALYWSTYLDNMTLRPGVVDFLNAVKPIPIVIVTDLLADQQFRKIVHLGLQDEISAIVTSEEAGHDKPHPSIFHIAAEKVGQEPSTLCMIGDSWEKDILGALHFNMHCYWFRHQGGASQRSATIDASHEEFVHEFRSFAELINQVAAVV